MTGISSKSACSVHLHGTATAAVLISCRVENQLVKCCRSAHVSHTAGNVRPKFVELC